MRFHVQNDVQVTRWTTPIPHLPFARQPDLGAVVYTGRDGDIQLTGGVNSLFSLTHGTRDRNGLPLALADGTGGNADEGTQDGALHLPDLAGTIAFRTTDRRRSRLRPRASTLRAYLVARDLDLFLAPEDRLLKGQLQVITQIGATPRSPAGGGTKPKPAPEDLLEDLKRITKAKVISKASTARPDVTEAVVGDTFLRIREHLVGFVDLLKSRLSVRRVVDVRVILTRQSPICLLDLVLSGRASDPQHLVVVPLTAHALPSISE